MLKCLPNMPACHLGILHDLRGPVNTITQRDVGANLAVAEASRWIRDGEVDAVLVGAASTLLTETNRRHATLEAELAPDAEAVCRPFDRRRQGPPAGEGAAALVLEEFEFARARGARLYGEVLGCAAATRIGGPPAEGCRRALAATLQLLLPRSGLTPGDVGHLHAHGLGTPASDLAEAQALVEVFGEELARLPVVAAKSRLAHAGAASGGQELVASLLAWQHGRLFPVWNTQDLDPRCPVRLASVSDAGGDVFVNINLFGRGAAAAVAVGRVSGTLTAARTAA
jgi:3-oxoacyl-[acyl-carrier-protein] synthase II